MLIVREVHCHADRRRWPTLLCFAVFVALLFAACSAENTTHVVQTGESLSAIAEQYCGSVDAVGRIFERNVGRSQPNGETFSDQRLIIPGQELEIDCGETDTAQSLMELFEANRAEAFGLAAALLILALLGAILRSFRHEETSVGGTDSRPESTPTVSRPSEPNRPKNLVQTQGQIVRSRQQAHQRVLQQQARQRQDQQRRRSQQQLQAQQRMNQQRQDQQRRAQQQLQAQQRMAQQRRFHGR